MSVTVDAQPAPVALDPAATALLVIDMQRDFLEPGGFGESLGNDVSLLRACVEPCGRLMQAMRAAGVPVLHTREGHRPGLEDVHPEKQARCAPGRKIGDAGPMGRILVRGEAGHDIIEELYPLPGEVVIDKPGKGAFFATDLDLLLRSAGVRDLIVCGVTTEVCVHTTVREANDRGYRVLVPGDCCGSYFEEFHKVGLAMISAQGGIFGAVTTADAIIEAFGGKRDGHDDKEGF
ncbi:cysteine hydrolase [Mangrovimicrobium sediminis]|uniref:Cysteine hydrolase n=1 Tax=Mangrovimicrobium sediminis TaxID=2562682 RepID=A0A4Z0M530_9GAMM|nr:isochorismatase family cysteine hydrolase [Haliea sp. SAOS-164]TGD74591.1 cysteine hydrolase [Haliea sp. SAOS-164]